MGIAHQSRERGIIKWYQQQPQKKRLNIIYQNKNLVTNWPRLEQNALENGWSDGHMCDSYRSSFLAIVEVLEFFHLRLEFWTESG